MNSSNNKPLCIVCDIDGTVANNEHRQPLVRQHPKNWHEFNALIPKDTAHKDIVMLVKHLQPYYPIIFCSGRGEEDRAVTEHWLKDTAKFEYWDGLYMRPEADNRDDTIIKAELIDQIEKQYEIFLVLDDRQRVVDMMRARGLRVLQVNYGDF